MFANVEEVPDWSSFTARGRTVNIWFDILTFTGNIGVETDASVIVDASGAVLLTYCCWQ